MPEHGWNATLLDEALRDALEVQHAMHVPCGIRRITSRRAAHAGEAGAGRRKLTVPVRLGKDREGVVRVLGEVRSLV